MDIVYHATPLFPTKVCKGCKLELFLEEFGRNLARKDGLKSRCIQCEKALRHALPPEEKKRRNTLRNSTIAKRKERAKQPQPVTVPTTKICTSCSQELPFDAFPPRKDSKDGLDSWCRECKKAYHHDYYSDHDDPQTRREQVRLRYATDPEFVQRQRESIDAWRRANPLKMKEYCMRRHARIAQTSVDDVSYEAILSRDGFWCYICQSAILPHHKLEFDHFIPLDRGGPHSEENIRVTHQVCNRRKANKLISELTPLERRGVE